jgi:hypothetical protein
MKPVRNLLLATLVSSVCSSAFAAGTDELWEIKSTLKTGGQDMAMPAATNCIPKGQTAPPAEKTCKTTSQGSLVGKFSAVIECPGPPPTTMKIEGTRTATTMQGTMTVLGTGSDSVAMTQEYSGKIVGTCDAAEFAKKAQAGMGGGMPGGGMPGAGMASDPSAMPYRRSGSGGAAVAAKPADAAAIKEAKDTAKDESKGTPKDATSKTIDAAKKALGGLLPF